MYFLLILYSVLLVVAVEPQKNGKISSQLSAFHDAVAEAREELSNLRDAIHGGDDDKLLRQRRRTIDQLLANFQKDAVMADEMVANGDWSRMIDDERLDQMCGTRTDSCGPKKVDKHGDACKKDPCDDIRMSNIKKKRKYGNGFNTNNRFKELVSVADESEAADGADKMQYDIWSDSENADAISGNYQGIDAAYNEVGVDKKQYDFEDVPLEDVVYDDANYASLVNDQVNTAKNDLSHEANYKLSKIEQDAAEKRKVKNMPLTKRSTLFNPMNEIKLKTSRRMMRKGYGPSLPSYSLVDTRRDMLIDDMVKKMERSYKPSSTSTSTSNSNGNSNYEYEKYKVLDELHGSKDYKRRGNSYGGYGTLGLGLMDIDHGRVLNTPVKRFITPKSSSEYDDRSRDKRYAVGVETVSQSSTAVEEKKPQAGDVAAIDAPAKLVKNDAKDGESKIRVKRIDDSFSTDQKSGSSPTLLKLGADFGFVSNEERSKRGEDKAAKAAEEKGVRKKRYASTEDEIFEEYKDFDSMEQNEDDTHSRLKRSAGATKTDTKKRHKRSLDQQQLAELNMDSKNDQKAFQRSTKNYGNGKFDTLWYEQDIVQNIDIPKKKTSSPRFAYSKLIDGVDGDEDKNDGFDLTFDLQGKGSRAGNKDICDNYASLPSENYDNDDNNNKNMNRHFNIKEENANRASFGHISEKGPIPIILIEAKQDSYDNDERRLHSENSLKSYGNNGKIEDEVKVNSEDEFANKNELDNGDKKYDTNSDKDKISKSDENLVMALRDEILNCTNYENLEKIIKKIRSNTTNWENGTLANSSDPAGLQSSNATAADKKDDNVKLNITINASVSGNQKAKNFCGNGTINVRNGLLEDRERRRVRGISHRRHNRRHRLRGAHRIRGSSQSLDCKPPGQSGAGDNSGLDNLVTGKLSQQLVKSIMSLVHSNPRLKPLLASFKRQRPGSHNHMKNFYSIRNKGNEQQIQNSEQMLNKAMESISDIIEQQVRSRTCIPLRPDLMSFYELILKCYTDQEPGREKRSSTLNWITDFTKDIRAIDPNRIDEKSRIVKKLLQQYDELPIGDRVKAVGIRDDLLRDLMYLRKVKENQAILLERRKRMVIAKEKLNLRDDDAEAVRKLEAQFSPEYMKLLKTSAIFRDVSNDIMPADHIV